MRSGPQSIAAGAFAVGENSPSAQTKGLGTRARVRIFACVTTILGPVRRGIYEAEKAIVNSGFGGTPGEMPWEMCGLGGAKRASSSGLPPTVLEGLAQ